MTETGVFEILGSITVGTVVAWILALTAVGVALYKAGREIYKWCKHIKNGVDKEQNLGNRVNILEDNYGTMSESMQYICDALDALREERVAEQRHVIVKSGEECMERGWISVRELRSLCEIFEQYERPGRDGKKHNGYVATLMDKVKKLPVRGRLNEHGEDIDEVDYDVN